MTVAPAVVVVLVTAPSRDVAEDLVSKVVEERLAACGNIVPDVVSIYRWDGAVQRQPEVMIIFKTERAAVPRLLARIADLHPYDVPEALALDVVAGLPPYLAWVAANAGG
ncbi:MAG TPA: divalent-cation tolerance protein CutA [Longimicrobiales bacterium]|nr:divalent-cation tolerance protein CutA [Longimicrobiales bacterium]